MFGLFGCTLEPKVRSLSLQKVVRLGRKLDRWIDRGWILSISIYKTNTVFAGFKRGKQSAGTN